MFHRKTSNPHVHAITIFFQILQQLPQRFWFCRTVIRLDIICRNFPLGCYRVYTSFSGIWNTNDTDGMDKHGLFLK